MRQPGCDIGVDHQADLCDRYGEYRRNHLPDNPPHASILKSTNDMDGNTRQHTDFDKRRYLDTQLQQAADKHGKGQRQHRLFQIRRDKKRSDDKRYIEQYRREGRHPEFTPGIEYTACQRHQRHEQDVREHDPRHQYGQVENIPLVTETGRDQIHHDRRSDNPDDANKNENPHQCSRNLVHQLARRLFTLLVDVFGKNGDKCLGERAFRKQSSQQVGNAERDEKRIGETGCAKRPSYQQLTNQPCDTREHGHAGDGQQCLEQVHGAAL